MKPERVQVVRSGEEELQIKVAEVQRDLDRLRVSITYGATIPYPSAVEFLLAAYDMWGICVRRARLFARPSGNVVLADTEDSWTLPCRRAFMVETVAVGVYRVNFGSLDVGRTEFRHPELLEGKWPSPAFTGGPTEVERLKVIPAAAKVQVGGANISLS